ncbi:glycosyltransferase family 1 protein [Actinopolyspora mortivallis]|uniref:Glycosyltransferase family 1 protein n=2 Tax=Actinopolyspora mortivallis TaxID=33906 RepID=A0A2T0GUQ8_ACTMO|nr:glycosyltransferase family 1 protein [Actinopolyspora mortivallis]
MFMVITRLDGGAGVVALRSAVELLARSHAVTIVAGVEGGLLERARRAGVPTVVEPSLCRPIRPWRDLTALFRLTRLFLRERVDVVHTHTAKAGAVGRLAARLAGVPRVVHTYHGFPFHPFQPGFVRESYVRIERLLGPLTDTVLCVGKSVTAEAVERGLVPPGRARTVGVPVSREVPCADAVTRARARRELGVAEHGLLVGAVGRLTYQKAPEHFVTALRLLSERHEVRGVWVGDGELRGSVAALARRELGDGLLLTGEREDVLRLLPAFDVFVLPSRYEGLPLALVEAMWCGLPVVATAVNAVPDLVVPPDTGLLVPPERPDALAAAVSELLESPVRRARTGEAARRRIDERFDLAAHCDETERAYRLEHDEHRAK